MMKTLLSIGLCGATLVAAGCVAEIPCAGTSDVVGADAPVSPRTACRARAGDAQAQFAFGQAEAEAGNHDSAMRWYRRAAEPRVSRTYVYSPAVGSEDFGRVIPIGSGRARPGYAPAQLALGELYLAGEGVDPNPEKAAQWLRRAAAQGSAEAAARLRSLGLAAE